MSAPHAEFGFASQLRDPREFVREGRTLQGMIELARLPRLADALARTEGEVAFVIAGNGGGKVGHGRPGILVSIRAHVALVCQRCLAPCEHAIDHVSTVLLARSEAEADSWDAADEEVEVMVAGEELDIADLVEQEMLLALPYAPMHPPGACPINEPPTGLE
jgi:uncharacterized protein